MREMWLRKPRKVSLCREGNLVILYFMENHTRAGKHVPWFRMCNMFEPNMLRKWRDCSVTLEVDKGMSVGCLKMTRLCDKFIKCEGNIRSKSVVW